MSYDTLRRGRYSRACQAYCITAVTLRRRPVFAEFVAARLLVRELRRLHDDEAVRSLAWVVMPDHLHWLLQLGDEGVLGQVVKTLKGRSAVAINRRLGRSGSVWQRAYFDRAIRREADIRPAARYIVANPLRAGLVGDIRCYPHWDCIWMTDQVPQPL